MRRLIIYFSLFVILIAGIYSCTQNPNGGIPFYLRIDSASLVTNPTTQGSNTQNITDVWVQAGTSILGAYQMPCNFPVLEENSVFFVVNAGVEVDGQVGFREQYPFYAADTFTIIATPGKMYYNHPTFKYIDGVVFPFIPIDFQFSIPFDSMSPANGPYGRCGQITVTATGDSNVVASQVVNNINVPYSLPMGQEVWLEVDYQCTVPFNIGFWANYTNNPTVQYPEMYVFAQPNWTKLYVSFTQDVSNAAATSYSIYFEGLRPFGSNGGYVRVDNVKVVTD